MFCPQIFVNRELDSLTRQRYCFHFIDEIPGLVLAAYYFQTRASKRHKWTTEAFYGRLNPRETTLSLSEVPFPEDVQEEALNILKATFKVAKDYRR